MIDDDSYGEEENEEAYIDPNDLIIIPKESESMWEPTEEQIHAYALKLQMNLETDPPETIDIAYKYLTEQLPDEWTRAFTKDRFELLYVNLETNEIQLETDLEAAARKEYEDYMKLIKAQNEKENTKVTVVPRTKIAPIGSKQNQKNERKKESSNKKSKSKSNKNKNNIDNVIPSYKHNPSYNNEIFQPANYEEQNNNDYEYDENIKIDNTHNNFSSDININIKNDENEFSLSQGKYARNNKRHNKELYENNDELIEKMKEIDKEESKTSKNKPKTQTKKDTKNNYVNIEIEVNKQKHSTNKHSSSFNENNSNQKQQPQLNLNNKPTFTEEDEELSDNESNGVYSKENKKNNNNQITQSNLKYLQQQKDKIDKNAENELKCFKQKLLEKVKAHKQKLISNIYNKTIETELNKIKKEYETKTKGVVSALKSEYKTKLQIEKEKIKKELMTLSLDNNEYNDEGNSKLEDLTNQKLQIQTTITNKKEKKERERERLIKEQQNELKKQTQRINESTKTKKENISKQHNHNVTNLQNEHNSKIKNLQIIYNEQYNTLCNNKQNYSYDINTDSKVKEILKEYQRNLDKIYKHKQTEIEEERKKQMHNELEIFKNVTLTENEIKINFYNNETKQLRNKFNSELNDLQLTNTTSVFHSEQKLHNDLNNVHRLFEKIKHKIE